MTDRMIGKRAFREVRERAGSGTLRRETDRIGISRKLVYRWNSMEAVPGASALRKLADAGYDVPYILTGRRSK